MWVYPEIRTLGDLTAYYARHKPTDIVLAFEGQKIDWRLMDERVNRTAHMLIAAGVRPGGRVAFLGKNSDDFFIAMFAVAKIAASFVPLNWRLSHAELGEIIIDCEPQVIIVEREHDNPLELAIGAKDERIVKIVIDQNATLSSLSAERSATAPGIPVSEDDVAIQLYTSGTTGQPKGVLLTHGGLNRMRLCEHLEAAYGWTPGERFLFVLPNFHLLGIGLALQCLYNGLSLTIQRRFDPAAALRSIGEDRPALLVLTPTMLQMLLDHSDAATTDFSSLRLTMYAGSPISLGLIKRAIAAMPCAFMQFYGATETSGAVSLLRPEEHDLTNESKLKSCGRPLPLIALRIVDMNGDDVPDGEPGELLVRSPAISSGYWRQPDVTDAVFNNGWYRTGDVARRDKEGLYYIVDRTKDMIVTGGENVYSAEIEHVISVFPPVSAVAVIGVPDERWGEAIKAIIVPKAEATIDLAELNAFCRDRLAAYKIPKSFEIAASLPQTATGKVSKKELRSKYWTSVDRSVA